MNNEKQIIDEDLAWINKILNEDQQAYLNKIKNETHAGQVRKMRTYKLHNEKISFIK